LICRNSTRRFKGLSDADSDTADAAARLPLDIYRAREAGLDSEASDAIGLLLAERYAAGRALLSAASERDLVAGTCYSSDSTAMRLARDGSVEVVPLSLLSEGNRILALDSRFKSIFAEVVGIARSRADEGYVDIVTSDAARGMLKATMHHLFPLCGTSNAVVRAKDIRKGNCLHTTAGQKQVTSVSRVAATGTDMTYSLNMKGDVSMVNIGGVFTLAKAGHGKAVAIQSNANVFSKATAFGASHRAKARFESFLEDKKRYKRANAESK
jgi:hypothetical protein